MKKREQQGPQGVLRSAFAFAFVSFIAMRLFISVVPSFAGSDQYFYDELNRLIRVESGNGAIIEEGKRGQIYFRCSK